MAGRSARNLLIHDAAASGSCGPLVLRELNQGVDISASDASGATPLWLAACTDNADVAELLIMRGAAMDEGNALGWTPLMTACKNGDIECARLLLQHRANVNSRSNDGLTPLMRAARWGATDCAAPAPSRRARRDPSRQDSAGRSAPSTKC